MGGGLPPIKTNQFIENVVISHKYAYLLTIIYNISIIIDNNRQIEAL